MNNRSGKLIIGIVSYGDRIHKDWDKDHGLNTLDKVDHVFRQWAENGVGRIQWRVGTYGNPSRYGVNILETDFDLDAWRRLRGEYLTQFLREIRGLTNQYNKKFTVLTQRGDHLGHPISNMVIDWRRWVKEEIIDDLGIGIYGRCWVLPGGHQTLEAGFTR